MKQGRSATALAKAFSIDPVNAADANDIRRNQFEEELKGAPDLDDPLEVWLRYLTWTKETFPSGHNAHSGYIQLLERCSKQFVQSPHYANDPRYLKVWIEYARYSDDPRELFCFLARNNIGQELATFYEEYAAFLEVRNRKGQADEIYQMGIMNGARPMTRLRRRYDEFSQRLAANPPSPNEPCSPPIAPVRPALTLQFGGRPTSAPTPKVASTKLQIFTDEVEPSEEVGTGGWGSIGTLRNRRKENTVEVKTMFGEKLPQLGQNRPAEKLEIFKDEPTIKLKPAGDLKKNERVACNLEAMYADGQEFSFEELKAKAMGLLNAIWTDAKPEAYVSVMDTESPIKDSPKVNVKRQMASPTINTKAAMDDILGIFSQPLKCEQSDDSSDSDSDDDQPDNTFPVSQDWTEPCTQDTACSDYQSDFDDEPPLPSSDDLLRPQPVEDKENVPATPQQAPTRAGGFNMMTPITEDTEQLLSALRTKPITIAEEDESEPYSSPFVENPPPRSNIQPPKKMALAEKMKTTSTIAKLDPPTGPTKGPLIQETICNPMDSSIRQTIFALMFPQLKTYEHCYLRDDISYGKKFEAIEKYIKALHKKGNEATQHLEVILDFSARFTIKKKLGEGAFAPVFLLENISGVNGLHRNKLEAVKIEKPGNAWEFHIMRLCHRRLGVHRATQSIARAHEYHQFNDCSFLLIDYQHQGTLLDLVNASRTDAGGVDELLAIWLTVELLRTIEALHSKGIMHGDLKADNCLLRLDALPDLDWSPTYRADGSEGWQSKGVTLIDFGRGIDTRNFRPDVQFIADWACDSQDCIEMRDARPWTWQIDYHGLACIVHSLLFGKYIDTVHSNRRTTLRTPFKRYWSSSWDQLFDTLLNPVSFEVAQLTRLRETFERQLEASQHGKLKKLIRSLE